MSSQPQSDKELVTLVQGGKPRAAGVLYDRYFPLVWRFVTPRVSYDRDAAEDVVSETFLTAFQTIAGYQPRQGGFHPWLMGIARNKTREWRRAQGRTQSLEWKVADIPQSEANGDALVVSETRAMVHDLLDTMPDDHRVVLEWKYLEGLSVADIAARIGRSTKAVEGLLYRSRMMFRSVHKARQTQSKHP